MDLTFAIEEDMALRVLVVKGSMSPRPHSRDFTPVPRLNPIVQRYKTKKRCESHALTTLIKDSIEHLQLV